MKILVIGSGGREHALVWKLAKSPHVTQMWCAPGNAGIAQERTEKTKRPVECPNISAEDLPRLLAFAQEKKIELTVVGPDNPLALGIVDLFQKSGVRIWGPNQKAAQFESSKVFSQRFMEKYGIPTARAGTFNDASVAKRFAESLDGKCAVKADGLALGKGVLICGNVAEANRAIDEILVSKAFGVAGANIVIQEFLEGIEISLHALCDGRTAKIFPTSQDHKRALDSDQGLNTGGMGTYSPTPFLSDAELAETSCKILEPFMRGCAAEGIDFRGILYPGLMVTKSGPKILEFNARFGDPETQVYLTRLENDLVELLDASVSGTLDKIELKWSPMASVCVVMASGGYPGNYAKGKKISGIDSANVLPGTKVFHAGTARAGDDVVTNGGRVLGVTALGKDLRAAQAAAYAAVGKIHFDGAHFRRDIAAKAFEGKMTGGLKNPLVTVICATYNSKATLRCALRSVLNQNLADFEVRIVGDACTDGTEEVVAELNDARLHWYNFPKNTGSQSEPNNEGLRRARGRYVAFIGHDDLWFPWHLSRLVKQIEAAGADLVHDIIANIGPEGVEGVYGPPHAQTGYNRILFPPSSWLHRRELPNEIGFWRQPDELPWAIDYDFSRRAAEAGKKIEFVPSLGVLKFHSIVWKLYSRGDNQPQERYLRSILESSLELCEKTLSELAAQYAQNSQWQDKKPLGLACAETGRAAKGALKAVLRELIYLYGQERWPLDPLLRWRMRRIWSKRRIARGLDSPVKTKR